MILKLQKFVNFHTHDHFIVFIGIKNQSCHNSLFVMNFITFEQFSLLFYSKLTVFHYFLIKNNVNLINFWFFSYFFIKNHPVFITFENLGWQPCMVSIPRSLIANIPNTTFKNFALGVKKYLIIKKWFFRPRKVKISHLFVETYDFG